MLSLIGLFLELTHFFQDTSLFYTFFFVATEAVRDSKSRSATKPTTDSPDIPLYNPFSAPRVGGGALEQVNSVVNTYWIKGTKWVVPEFCP